jgi:hypothetical protein
MSYLLKPISYGPARDNYVVPRRTVLAAMAGLFVNVLPQLLSTPKPELEFGKIYRYYGTTGRVLCEADKVVAPNTAPAFRLFHIVWFEGEEMDTYVAHADFVRHPDFEKIYPHAADRRRLHFMNQ